MRDAAQHTFDCVLVWKIDRFGRSVLHLNQQLAALSSNGVRFIATSQSLDTDRSNPTSRLLLQILASVAEFEREVIRERTLMGLSGCEGQRETCWPSEACVSPGPGDATPGRGPLVAQHRHQTWHSCDDGCGCVPLLLYGNCRGGSREQPQ